jgi:hypothetical protein
MLTLRALHERKIGDLIPDHQSTERWEASGVLVKGEHYFVVFDDRREIARIAHDLEDHGTNGLLGTASAEFGYEGITYNVTKDRFYLLVEARKHSKSCYQAVIVEHDKDFRYVKERPIDFTFERSNKGFEAVAHLGLNSGDYLLALCEGNKCKGGAEGRTPGGGRLLLFEKTKKCWSRLSTIALPKCLPFADYSGMAIDAGRVAIVSQVNSMLWIGQLDEANWSWRGDGELYQFPRSESGAIQYGNIEGVGWLTPTRVVAVSDRRKRKSQPDKKLSEKDQSVHIFEIPS